MGRTALHYAAAIPDAGYIYSTLVTAGAKEDVKDLVCYVMTSYLHLVSIGDLPQ